MVGTHDEETGKALAERLKRLGVRGILITMARNGQLLELACEMPTCYNPRGREHFEKWPEPRSSPDNRWSPNPDHYPQLKMHGGKLAPWNVRLAHVFCNQKDFGWRSRIHAMLKKKPTASFEEIAEVLNRRKSILLPPNADEWTAEIVRRAYIS
jgi:hypothetical protein